MDIIKRHSYDIIINLLSATEEVAEKVRSSVSIFQLNKEKHIFEHF